MLGLLFIFIDRVVCLRFGFPAAFATAGSMLDLLFNFIDWVVCLRFGFPAAFATAGSVLDYFSISLTPVRGGTHFLCCAKESKQRKALHTAKPKCPPLA
jgi:hypothetical protein